MTKKNKNKKRILLVFVITLLLAIALMIAGGIKTWSYNQKYHMTEFERENLFSEEFADVMLRLLKEDQMKEESVEG